MFYNILVADGLMGDGMNNVPVPAEGDSDHSVAGPGYSSTTSSASASSASAANYIRLGIHVYPGLDAFPA